METHAENLRFPCVPFIKYRHVDMSVLEESAISQAGLLASQIEQPPALLFAARPQINRIEVMLSESTPREWQQVPHNPQLLRRFVFDPQPFRPPHVRRRVLVEVSFTPYLRRRMGKEPGRLDSLDHTS